MMNQMDNKNNFNREKGKQGKRRATVIKNTETTRSEQKKNDSDNYNACPNYNGKFDQFRRLASMEYI